MVLDGVTDWLTSFVKLVEGVSENDSDLVVESVIVSSLEGVPEALNDKDFSGDIDLTDRDGVSDVDVLSDVLILAI